MMASFYLDENVTNFLVDDLKRAGHEATTTTQERRSGAPDPHQLLFAAERGWTIITHNRHDFQLLHDAWLLWSHRWGSPQTHAGILVLDSFQGQTSSDIAGTIAMLLGHPATRLDGHLHDWRRSTGWIRFPD